MKIRYVRILICHCCLFACLFVFNDRTRAVMAGDTPSPEGVVVLTDGRVFSGTITEAAGGYRVESQGSYVILPFDRVRLTATSMASAYEALRDGNRKPTTDDHLTLAEWCLKNNLPQQARTEVALALKLEPLRSDARALLQKIDQRLTNSGDTAAAGTGAGQPPITPVSLDQRTAAGLGRESLQVFIRKVQPLLVNKCGNAHCHGSSAENSFQLIGVRLTSLGHRSSSEENLKTILQFINVSNPKQSPLLVKSREPALVHQKLFVGSRQHEQFALLENWVLQVAQDFATDRGSMSQPGTTPPDPPPSSSVTPAVATAIEPTTPTPKGTPARHRELLDEIRREQLPDAFDPDIFNRRVHGMTAREYREGIQSGTR